MASLIVAYSQGCPKTHECTAKQRAFSCASTLLDVVVSTSLIVCGTLKDLALSPAAAHAMTFTGAVYFTIVCCSCNTIIIASSPTEGDEYNSDLLITA